MNNDPDFEVNVHDLSDADLVRWVADGLRPSPLEHSIVSARMYTIASRVAITDTAARRAAIRRKFTIVEGGKSE